MAEGDDHVIEITSTELTKALEDKAFEEAEKIIKENRDSSYLNKGAYGSLPLILVLSGEAGYRNFYLAQLLVKQGAYVNPYFPRQMADSTPLELVINFYLFLRALSKDQYLSVERRHCVPTVIGLHREVNPPLEILKAQCWEFINLLLAYGADPGVVTNPRVPPIFHMVVADKEPDVELVMKLYEAGGDFNREDIHGNTPLMDYIAVADRDSALPLFSQVISVVTELHLDHKNCNDETMLWHAMLAGSPRIATSLIDHGASPTVKATLLDPTSGVSLKVSPIFAPLIQNSVPYISLHENVAVSLPFTVSCLDKVMSCSVFPVVDSTDICDSIISELEVFLSSKTRFPMKVLVNQEIHGQDAALLMFGYLKCGLQQLCIRKIMEHLVVRKQGILDVVENAEEWRNGSENRNEDSLFVGMSLGEEGLTVMKLNPPVIECLVRNSLKLPSSLVPRFLIEGARLQMGAYLLNTESPACQIGCGRESNYGSGSMGYCPSNYSDSDDSNYDYESSSPFDWG